MKHVIDVGKLALALVVAGAALMLLAPVAVHASGQLVTLVDRESDVQTRVDAGRLRVGDGDGPLTVDGVSGQSYRGRTPYHDLCGLHSPDSTTTDVCVFDAVPANKVLVITHISAFMTLPSAQGIYSLDFDIVPEDDPIGGFYLGSEVSTTQGANRHLTYAHPTEIAVPGGVAPSTTAYRNAPSGVMNGAVTIFGYLTNG